MKKTAIAFLVAAAVAVPELAYARDVTLTAQIATYRGPEAYFAVYVTNPDGTYNSTLWVAGRKTRYYRHLRDWARGVSSVRGRIDGVTGASAGSGQQVSVRVSIADTLIDAGFSIHVDSAVEDGREYASDIVVPLAQSSVGVPAAGRGYVASLTLDM